MSARFSLDVLKPGMTLKTAIMYQGGQLLAKGSTLTERHIKQLVSWGVDFFETEEGFTDLKSIVSVANVIQQSDGDEAEVIDLVAAGMVQAEPEPERFVPKGYEIDGGATYVIDDTLDHVDEPIILDKNILVQGIVAENVRIESSGNIQIAGDVHAGAKIIAGGDVTIRGAVTGTEESPVLIQAVHVNLAAAEFAHITARQTIHAVSLSRCLARAGGEVSVVGEEPGILAGETESGSLIKAVAAEGKGGAYAILRVLLARQKQLFMAITRIDKTMEEKQAEIAKLEKVIEVIKLLGEKVVTLPTEKKQELALQSKRYMELKQEILELTNTLERIKSEVEDDILSIDDCPIQVKTIYPGVEIVLGSASLRLNARQGATGYYQKKGRILAHSQRD